MTIQKNNPLHGLTLQHIVESLVKKLGWEQMHEQVKINCFANDPSIKSSLKFLRKTPWARSKVESLYLYTMRSQSPQTKKQPEPVSAAEEFVWPEPKKPKD
ncbi:DNA-binding protein [Paraglaciecola mesophila]|uniref:DNA-binding protein n=1 Tax=Paraglaciecola mesophila TaxID=197222 RepID=A0A857JKA6_9ALTE|nr:VF530 family protein [Paraglaciecola mesophila]QHJ11074.1 DNA-binding protein [Paraglaciecola mesophila]